MLSKIPSWAVAVAGGIVVVVASLTSSNLIHQSRSTIAVTELKILDVNRELDYIHNGMNRADQYIAGAEAYVAQAVDANAAGSFLLEKAAYGLRGAVLSMWVVSGEPVPDQTPKEIARSESALRSGDLGAAQVMRSEIERLRLLAFQHMGRLNAVIHTAQAHIATARVRESRIYLAYMCINLFGFALTISKDLPVWRTACHRKHRHHQTEASDVGLHNREFSDAVADGFRDRFLRQGSRNAVS